jgi:NAD(P)-dependent dehydrogenase (short-subunit alcohol dehydrogenase family)
MKLKGRVAIVTGGAMGIGRAYALGLAEEGADIVIADIDLGSAKEVAAEVETLGRRALAVKADVTKKEEVEQLVEKTVSVFGRIDILVNNAGIAQFVPTEELDKADWDRVIGVNLTGELLCAQAVARQMIKQKYGKIINIASTAAHRGLPGLAAYCASKGGIVALTRALAVEWAQHNINVNSVSPGSTVTPMTVGTGLDVEKEIQRTPLARINQPEDLVGAVVFLASPASDNITGQDILVDGGITALYWPNKD